MDRRDTSCSLKETLFLGTVRTTSFDILVDFAKITKDQLNDIGAARWTTEQHKAKSQDGDNIQFSSTFLLDLLVLSMAEY